MRAEPARATWAEPAHTTLRLSALPYPMIRIVLLGRTGNHLFQYAIGRVLARRHRVPLVLDGSWFNQAGWEQVSHFLNLPIQAEVVRRCSLGARLLRKTTGLHYWELRRVPVLREPPDDQSFDPRFLKAPSDCMLFGYFQTPHYFEDMADELRAELRELLIRHVPLEPGHTHALTGENKVAIHVRRKDYLEHSEFRVIGADYYHSQMDALRASLPTARFFVFSDDPEWCRNEFQSGDTEIIDSGKLGQNPLYDLHLMSLASHHIIANSTYSWWAAWIGEKPGQRVIMPDRWYAHGITAPIHEKRGGYHWTEVAACR
jgi:Glycosyl transferase family 11